MLRSIDALHGYSLAAIDGDIGSVEDCYFDDELWTVRYLVADTGGWLSGRKVLITPPALRESDWRGERLGLALTREQIEQSPDIDTDKPISRQREAEYFGYYGYPPYWGGLGLWGAYSYPYMMVPPVPVLPAAAPARRGAVTMREAGDEHLRSVRAVTGYDIAALDGEIGHVDDFILDDQDWAIRWLVVSTGAWLLGGRKVLVSPRWVAGVSWGRRQVDIDLLRVAIEGSPEYDPTMPVNREYEARLYDYYGRPVYWP